MSHNERSRGYHSSCSTTPVDQELSYRDHKMSRRVDGEAGCDIVEGLDIFSLNSDHPMF